MRERRGQPPRRDGNEEAVGEWREKLATERSTVKGSSSSQRVRDGQHVRSYGREERRREEEEDRGILIYKFYKTHQKSKLWYMSKSCEIAMVRL